MSLIESLKVKISNKSELIEFSEKLTTIKACTEAMLRTLPLYDTNISKPGKYWEPDSFAWNVGMELFKHTTEDLFQNYRFIINEIYSGNPYGDYSQYQNTSESELLALPFVSSYQNYIADIPAKYHIEEPLFHSKRQWGVNVLGKRLSGDSARFQRYIANLYKLGIFADLENKIQSGRDVYILEIGAGFGMLADYICTVLPKNKVKFIIVDIPTTLAMAASYFALTKPYLQQKVFDPRSTSGFVLTEEAKRADLFFLPHYAADCLLDLPQIDLAINTFSFQEMAEDNIHYYAKLISQKLQGSLYSDNFRRHPHNFSLQSRVCDILKNYFYLFPNSEEHYDKVESTKNYMWQTYIHVGTSKQRPTFILPSTKYSDFIWGDNFKLNLQTGECA